MITTEEQEVQPFGICVSKPNNGIVNVKLSEGIYGPGVTIPDKKQKYRGEF